MSKDYIGNRSYEVTIDNPLATNYFEVQIFSGKVDIVDVEVIEADQRVSNEIDIKYLKQFSKVMFSVRNFVKLPQGLKRMKITLNSTVQYEDSVYSLSTYESSSSFTMLQKSTSEYIEIKAGQKGYVAFRILSHRGQKDSIIQGFARINSYRGTHATDTYLCMSPQTQLCIDQLKNPVQPPPFSSFLNSNQENLLLLSNFSRVRHQVILKQMTLYMYPFQDECFYYGGNFLQCIIIVELFATAKLSTIVGVDFINNGLVETIYEHKPVTDRIDAE